MAFKGIFKNCPWHRTQLNTLCIETATLLASKRQIAHVAAV